MSFDEMWNFIEKLKKVHGDDDLKKLAMILHFRITTHGGTSQENTHPFPISKDIEDLKNLSMRKLNSVVAHNGIVSCVSVGKKETISDTMKFISEQLSVIQELNKEWYKNDRVMDMLHDMIESKLCVMTGDGEMRFSGDFYEEEGVMFSNLYWKTNTGLRTGYCSLYDVYDREYANPYDSSWEYSWSDTISSETVAQLYMDTDFINFKVNAYMYDSITKTEGYLFEGTTEVMIVLDELDENGKEKVEMLEVTEFLDKFSNSFWYVEEDDCLIEERDDM